MSALRRFLAAACAFALFWLALGAAAVSVAAHGGKTDLRLDILTHFAPLWLGASALPLFFALFIHSRKVKFAIGVPALVGVIAAGSLILPELRRPLSPRIAADAPHQIKLIQFNTWGRNDEIDRTAQWIADQNAGIVVIEEATVAIREAILARRAYHASCRRCSVMIFSRAPPIFTAPPPLPEPWPGLPRARATFAPADGGFTVIGVHYTWPTDDDVQKRQGLQLAGSIARLDHRRLILAGDFNSTPWSFSRRREDALFGLERRTRALFSWPAARFTRFRIRTPMPFMAIDHVYAGGDWRTVSVKRGPKLGSDHYPVVVRLALIPR